MTDVSTTTPVFDADQPYDHLANNRTREQLATVRDLFIEWGTRDGQPREWLLWITEPGRTNQHFVDANLPIWTRDYREFLTWLRQPANRSRIPGAVPQGDTAPTTGVAPIGPDTPGWAEFWDQLYEEGGDDYTSEYNALASALGGPLRDDDSEQDYDVEITIPSFTVTITRSERRSLVDADGTGAFDDSISQDDVDEAIAEHIRYANVEWRITDYELTD